MGCYGLTDLLTVSSVIEKICTRIILHTVAFHKIWHENYCSAEICSTKNRNYRKNVQIGHLIHIFLGRILSLCTFFSHEFHCTFRWYCRCLYFVMTYIIKWLNCIVMHIFLTWVPLYIQLFVQVPVLGEDLHHQVFKVYCYHIFLTWVPLCIQLFVQVPVLGEDLHHQVFKFCCYAHFSDVSSTVYSVVCAGACTLWRLTSSSV